MAQGSGCALWLRVRRVEVSAEVPVVRLWVTVEERPEEQKQREEAAVLPEVGELCLVEVRGAWLRCKVLQRTSCGRYHVLLLDEGSLAFVAADSLGQAAGAVFFPIPAHEVAAVISRLAPPKGQTWNYTALTYLRALKGQLLKGYVEDVLLPQELLLLCLPDIVSHLLTQGLATSVDDQSFRFLLGCHSVAVNMSTTAMDYYYPDLQVGLTEPVQVTYVANPQRIFCQLRSMSREVQRLSERLQAYYEKQRGEQSFQQPMVVGQPCASRGTNGQWYRSLLEQFYPERHLALVIHVDFGFRDCVSMKDLHGLAADFFRMPVMTYCCALYGVTDVGMGWEPPLIYELRSLLQSRCFSAKIEYYNAYEHLYVVTLLAEDGLNLNCFYGIRVQNIRASADKCSVMPPPALDESGARMDTATLKESPANAPVAPIPAPKENGIQVDVLKNCEQKIYAPKHGAVELKIATFYDATVQFVLSPYCFWIRTEKSSAKQKELVDHLTSFYSQKSKLEGITRDPELGQVYCVKFQDRYHRAEVVEIKGKKVDAYFVDCGNLERVDWFDVKELPQQYGALPALANRCCLADVSLLEDTWSPEAIRAFELLVTDQKLVVYIVSKDDEKYTIEIHDQSRLQEKNIGKILAAGGLVRYQEPEMVSTRLEIIPGSGISIPPSQNVSKLTRQKPNSELLTEENQDGMDFSPFEEQWFNPGTTFPITVSHVENPGLFWCQATLQNLNLNNLMSSIQRHCLSDNSPYEMGSFACLAKSPTNNIWYRGFIPQMPNSEVEEFEVLYVDYGMKETVPVTNLRSIPNKFFELKSQAFKCSLYNMISPIAKDPFKWNRKATELFWEFVEETSKSLEFHITIYAIASVDGEFINIVDLHTPFKSLCSTLVERGVAAHLNHATLAPSVQLQSFYYSLHGFNLGSEEEIYITYVGPSLEFYCQLSKNSETVAKISEIAMKTWEKTRHLKLPCPGPLCIAKFSDGQWYRGCMSLKSDGAEVFFVDFGNTEKVAKDDLLPIGRSDYELLLQPVQAIKCSLPDLPPQLPEDVVSWFENAVLDKPLRAVAVAQSEGKLMVELYDGARQINATLKSKLGIKISKKAVALPVSQPADYSSQHETRETNSLSKAVNGERRTNASSQRNCDKTNLPFNKGAPASSEYKTNKSNTKYQESSYSAKPQEKNSFGHMSEPREPKIHLNSDRKREQFYERTPLEYKTDKNYNSKYQEFDSHCPRSRTRETNVGFNPDKSTGSQKPERSYRKTKTSSEQKVDKKTLPSQEIYSEVKYRQRHSPPLQSSAQDRGPESRVASQDVKAYREEPSIQKAHPIVNQPANPQPRPVIKLSDLPQISHLPGTKLPVYVSYASSVHDFYLQVADNKLLDEISEILNKDVLEVLQENDIHVGEVIAAYFSDDGLYYRGVVREKSASGLSVQYIDYGNTSNISNGQIYSLPEPLRSLYMMSFRCSLHKFSQLPDPLSAEELLNSFLKLTSDSQLDCEFVEQHNDKWEVILYGKQGCVNDLLSTSQEKTLLAEESEPIQENTALEDYMVQETTEDFESLALVADGVTGGRRYSAGPSWRTSRNSITDEACAIDPYSEDVSLSNLPSLVEEQVLGEAHANYSEDFQSENFISPVEEQVELPCAAASSLESLILQFDEKLVLVHEDGGSDEMLFKGRKSNKDDQDNEKPLANSSHFHSTDRNNSKSNDHGSLSELECAVNKCQLLSEIVGREADKNVLSKDQDFISISCIGNIEKAVDEESNKTEPTNFMESTAAVGDEWQEVETTPYLYSLEAETTMFVDNIKTISADQGEGFNATTNLDYADNVVKQKELVKATTFVAYDDTVSVKEEEEFEITINVDYVDTVVEESEKVEAATCVGYEEAAVEEREDAAITTNVPHEVDTTYVAYGEAVVLEREEAKATTNEDYVDEVREKKKDQAATDYEEAVAIKKREEAEATTNIVEELKVKGEAVTLVGCRDASAVKQRKAEATTNMDFVDTEVTEKKKCEAVTSVAYEEAAFVEERKEAESTTNMYYVDTEVKEKELGEAVTFYDYEEAIAVKDEEEAKASTNMGYVDTEVKESEKVTASHFSFYQEAAAVEQWEEAEATAHMDYVDTDVKEKEIDEAVTCYGYEEAADVEEKEGAEPTTNVDYVDTEVKEKEMGDAVTFYDYVEAADVEEREEAEATAHMDYVDTEVKEKEMGDAVTFFDYEEAADVDEREEAEATTHMDYVHMGVKQKEMGEAGALHDHEEAAAVEEKEKAEPTINVDCVDTEVKENELGKAVTLSEYVESADVVESKEVVATTHVDYVDAESKEGDKCEAVSFDDEEAAAVEETDDAEATTNVDFVDAVDKEKDAAIYFDYEGAVAVDEREECDVSDTLAVEGREEVYVSIFEGYEKAVTVEEKVESSIFEDIEEAATVEEVKATTFIVVDKHLKKRNVVGATNYVNNEKAAVVESAKIDARNYVKNVPKEVELPTLDNLKISLVTPKERETDVHFDMVEAATTSFCESEAVEDLGTAKECQNVSRQYAAGPMDFITKDKLQVEDFAFKNIIEGANVDQGKKPLESTDISKNTECLQISYLREIAKPLTCKIVLSDFDRPANEDHEARTAETLMKQLQPKHCDYVGEDNDNVMITAEEQTTAPKMSAKGKMSVEQGDPVE